jgi:CheY-like chemotaxis protein
LIALTGYGQDSDRARAQVAGFAEHLTKPVDLRRLLRAVEHQG